jgi:hypothetical protein
MPQSRSSKVQTSPLRRPAVDPGARCASVDRHGVGQLAAQALYEDIGRDQFCDAEDPERFVLTFAIKGLPGIGIEHIDGGRSHLGRSDGLLAERLVADQRDCRDRASTEREAGKRAALFFSVRRQGDWTLTLRLLRSKRCYQSYHSTAWRVPLI